MKKAIDVIMAEHTDIFKEGVTTGDILPFINEVRKHARERLIERLKWLPIRLGKTLNKNSNEVIKDIKQIINEVMK